MPVPQKSTISVRCFGCVEPPPHPSNRSECLHAAATSSPPGCPARRAKIKTSPFQQTDFYFAPLSPPFISAAPSRLPPHPLPFRRRSRGRGFALITDLLYTPVNRDRDALLTPPLAHCHIPSIPALLSKPVHQGAHELTCDWGLFLIVWQHLGVCSPLTDVRTSKGRRRCSQIR